MAREREHPFPVTVTYGSSTDQDRASLPWSLSTEWICSKWGKAHLRVWNGLRRELEAPLQAHLSQIAQTQRVPQPPHNDKQDKIGRLVQNVERRSWTLVEGSLARLSPQHVR